MTSGGRRWRLVRGRGGRFTGSAVAGRLRRWRVRARGRGRPPVRWLAVAVAVAVLAGWLVWASPLLGLRQVRVTGTEVLTVAQVRTAVEVADGTPLPRVPVAAVAERVAGLAPVERVRVRRSWPDTLVVEVVERTPVAAVPVAGGYRWVDATGLGFHTVGRPGDLPVLVVADPGPDDRATAAGLVVLASLTPPLLAALAAVRVDGPVRIVLELRDGRTVVWGDESVSEEKARVATALLGEASELIDVSTPEVVVAR
jgi:cell division protein FtsQ